LCFNLERSGAFENPTGVAKYIRLLPGEAFAGRIVQDLPIEGHVHGWQAERKKHKEIILQRAIFEIGYFGPELNRFFDSLSEEIKKNPDKSKPVITPGPFYYLQFNPFITEERLDGILREVMYIDENAPLIEEEKSVETIITDVNIPCSVVVEEKLGETKKLGTVTHLFLDMG